MYLKRLHYLKRLRYPKSTSIPYNGNTITQRLLHYLKNTLLPKNYTIVFTTSQNGCTNSQTTTLLHYLKRPRYLKQATLPHTTATLPPKRLHFLKTDYTTPNRLDYLKTTSNRLDYTASQTTTPQVTTLHQNDYATSRLHHLKTLAPLPNDYNTTTTIPQTEYAQRNLFEVMWAPYTGCALTTSNRRHYLKRLHITYTLPQKRLQYHSKRRHYHKHMSLKDAKMPPLKKGCSKHTTRPHHLKNTALPNNDHTTSTIIHVPQKRHYPKKDYTSKYATTSQRLHYLKRLHTSKLHYRTLPYKDAKQLCYLKTTTHLKQKSWMLEFSYRFQVFFYDS